MQLVYRSGSNPQFETTRFAELTPGVQATVPLDLTMPPTDVDVYVNLYYGTAGQGEATYGGYRGPYTILVKVDEWVHLEKPDWLRKTLNGQWLDELWGGLGSYIFGPLKPLFWSLGWLIEKAVDVLLNMLNTIINWSKEAWDRQWEQNIGLAGLIRGLGEDMSELRNFFGDIGAFFDQIFGRIVEELVKVEPFKTIISVVNTILDFLPEDWAELKNLLSNPVDYFFDRLDEWLNEEVSE